MTVRRLLDARGGVVSEFHYDDAANRVFINQVQDVEPFLEANKRAQIDSDGYSKSRELRHIGHVPNVILMQWAKADGVNPLKMRREEFSAWILRKLKDPDNRFFRTVDKL